QPVRQVRGASLSTPVSLVKFFQDDPSRVSVEPDGLRSRFVRGLQHRQRRFWLGIEVVRARLLDLVPRTKRTRRYACRNGTGSLSHRLTTGAQLYRDRDGLCSYDRSGERRDRVEVVAGEPRGNRIGRIPPPPCRTDLAASR